MLEHYAPFISTAITTLVMLWMAFDNRQRQKDRTAIRLAQTVEREDAVNIERRAGLERRLEGIETNINTARQRGHENTNTLTAVVGKVDALERETERDRRRVEDDVRGLHKRIDELIIHPPHGHQTS